MENAWSLNEETVVIKIITVEREYGSGGVDIARKLSERLGWTLCDQLITDRIARLLECESRLIEKHEERIEPLTYRLFKSFMRGSFEGSLNAPKLKTVDSDTIRRVAERVVTEAADHEHSIIVGRGSAYYLHTRQDAFHVFVYAPYEEKVRRLRAQGKTEADAVHLAETVDRDRAEFIKQEFNLIWPARYLYHLMVNSTMGDDAVIQTILDGIANYEKQAAPVG